MELRASVSARRMSPQYNSYGTGTVRGTRRPKKSKQHANQIKIEQDTDHFFSVIFFVAFQRLPSCFMFPLSPSLENRDMWMDTPSLGRRAH
jgi:hypothetical protein